MVDDFVHLEDVTDKENIIQNNFKFTREAPRKFLDPFATSPTRTSTGWTTFDFSSSNGTSNPTFTSRSPKKDIEITKSKDNFIKGELQDIFKDVDDPMIIASKIKEKFQKDHEKLQEQRNLEERMKATLDSNKVSMIEHYQISEEKLKQEMIDQRIHYEALLQTKETYYQQLLQEKDYMLQYLQNQIQTMQDEWKGKVSKNQESYLKQLETQEHSYHNQLQEIESQHKIQLQSIQKQIDGKLENQKYLETLHLETKEKQLEKQYNKKLLKYEKKLSKIIKNFQDRELLLKGALEESRREIQDMKTHNLLQEQSYQEELNCKDKRLLLIQQDIDKYDRVVQTVQAWKEIAQTLSSYVVYACNSVEELPQELWTVPTIAMFTSVYDHLQYSQNRQQPVEPSQMYREKQKECVVVKRLLLSKCLKYSKMIHERIQAEGLVSSK